MKKYPIDKKGKITSKGRYHDWSIEIKKSSPSAGGYLILIWSDETGEGYDGWVGSEEDIEGYFSESGWVVEWD